VRRLVSTATVTGPGASLVDASVRGGDFSWPKTGTSRGHQRGHQLAKTGDFLMATDKCLWQSCAGKSRRCQRAQPVDSRDTSHLPTRRAKRSAIQTTIAAIRITEVVTKMSGKCLGSESNADHIFSG
jgi:hypothetical protein